MFIDLNCDMGESFGAYTIGDDVQMLTIVSSANIACGFHAGDPRVIHKTLKMADNNGVQPGAHPGFFDLYGFGRREIRGTAMKKSNGRSSISSVPCRGLQRALDAGFGTSRHTVLWATWPPRIRSLPWQ